MVIGHDFRDNILIKEAFILKCINFLEQIVPNFETPTFRSPVILSFYNYICFIKYFIYFIDESDPYNNGSKYLPLLDRAHERGDFVYIVSTSYDDPVGLQPSDQIIIAKNVMYMVMRWVILSANDLIRNVNNSRPLNENIPYINKIGEVAQFSTEPHPKIKKIREFITNDYIMNNNEWQ